MHDCNMRTFRLFTVFALLTASSAAVAQTTPFVGRPGAFASGITVIGRGTAAAAPDRARISVQIYGNQGVANAGTLPLAEAADALVDALRASGVADVREVLPIGNLSTRSVAPAIVGTIAKPTRERLEAIARDVVKSLPDRLAPAYGNVQLQVSLLVDNCAIDEERAERAAFADARSRAARLAAGAGLRLGAVEAIADTQSFIPVGCSSRPDALDSPSNGPPTIGLYGPLVLPITVNETVTFAIGGP